MKPFFKKPVVLILSGVALACVCLFVLQKTKVILITMYNDQAAADTATGTCDIAQIDKATSDVLINEYESKNPNPDPQKIGLSGGRLCKEALELLVRDMDDNGDEYVNFRYGYSMGAAGVDGAASGSDTAAILILSAGSLIPSPASVDGKEPAVSDRIIIRNGYSNDCFCPTRCN